MPILSYIANDLLLSDFAPQFQKTDSEEITFQHTNLYELLGVDHDFQSGDSPSGRQVLEDGLVAEAAEIIPFLPMHRSAMPPPSATSENVTFQILLQPDAEITRNVYFDFRLKILQASKQSVASSQPTAELVYESNEPVPASVSVLY